MSSHPFASLLVTGADARSFLQGQLTCDIESLNRERPLLASVNSAQGRVQAILKVIERAEGIELRILAEMAERTLQRLRKYVLRSKVQIEHASLIDASRDQLVNELRAGIPHVFPATHEAFVAQMLNLDLLGAISFEKGCYTGQEIIARTHFRGAIKRRMFRFAAQGGPPAPATRILSAGAHAGDVVYAENANGGCELLAVISLAHANDALALDETPARPLTNLPLPYAIPN